MRSRNNIVPKNAAQLLLAGKNNIIDAKLKEGIIVGDGNTVGNAKNVTILGSSGCIVGSDCDNVVLLNSSGCIINPGLKNVSLTNTFDKTIEASNTTYQNNALQLPPQPNNTLTSVYEITVDVTSAEILNLLSSPKELIPSPGAGYFIQVVSASAKSFSGLAYTSFPIGIKTDTATANQWQWDVFINTSGGSIFQPDYIGEAHCFVSNKGVFLKTITSNPTGGNYDIRIYLTYVIRQE